MKTRCYSILLIAFIFLQSENNFCFAVSHQINSQSSTDENALRLFEERGDKNKLVQCITLLDSLLAKNEDAGNLVLASRAYHVLADYEDEIEKKLYSYDKGFNYGERALKLIPSFSTAMKDKKKEEESIKLLTIENISPLFWSAANLARWAKYASFINKIKVKSKVRALWDRVLELNPNYFYGGVYRFFGGYYALVPTITGEQDPAKSKEMFEKAIQAGPEYLDSKILYAEIYCTHAKIKDKALFEKLLNEVLNADISTHPEIFPENTLAKAKAKKLLEQEKELFE